MKKINSHSRFILLFVIILGIIFSDRFALAGAFTSTSDTLSNNDASAFSDHQMTFTRPLGNTFDDTDYIAVDFTPDFTLSGTWATADFTLTDANITINIQDVSQGADASANATMTSDCTPFTGVSDAVVYVGTDTNTFHFMACGSYTAKTIDAPIFIFTIKGTSPNATMQSPATANAYTVGLSGFFNVSSHTGSALAYIGNDGSVTLSATVDPTISLTLDTATCALGILSTSSISGCRVVANYKTNATGGLYLFMEDVTTGGVGLRRNGGGVISFTSGTLSAGTQGAGWSVSLDDNGAGGLTSNSCSNPIYVTQTTCESNGGTWTANTCPGNGNTTNIGSGVFNPVGVGSSVPLAFISPTGLNVDYCFSAAISSVTVAGSYHHEMRLTSVGTF